MTTNNVAGLSWQFLCWMHYTHFSDFKVYWWEWEGEWRYWRKWEREWVVGLGMRMSTHRIVPYGAWAHEQRVVRLMSAFLLAECIKSTQTVTFDDLRHFPLGRSACRVAINMRDQRHGYISIGGGLENDSLPYQGRLCRTQTAPLTDFDPQQFEDPLTTWHAIRNLRVLIDCGSKLCRLNAWMSKIKNSGLDQHGAKALE